MKKVLQRLEYIDKNEIVTERGRVASCIFGSDELLLTKLIFSGMFNKLDPKGNSMLLSIFINEDKKK